MSINFGNITSPAVVLGPFNSALNYRSAPIVHTCTKLSTHCESARKLYTKLLQSYLKITLRAQARSKLSINDNIQNLYLNFKLSCFLNFYKHLLSNL